jgi:hypothetical protein
MAQRTGRGTQETLEAALSYAGRGWAVVPVPHGEKKPITAGWPKIRLKESDLPRHFGNVPQNIGLLLGEPSGGLVDVDLDSTEALALAPLFLPGTDCIFGRQSKPRSHWLYTVSPILKTTKFQLPSEPRPVGERPMLVEYRSTGCQTIAPPSMHPENEAIRWELCGNPAQVDGGGLLARVARVAAGSLLVRCWPERGCRHDAALALAGTLLRLNWSIDEVEAFVLAVAQAAGDEEAVQRKQDARSTYKRLQDGGKATGLPRLASLLGPKLVDLVVQWLKVGSSGGQEPNSANPSDPGTFRPSVHAKAGAEPGDTARTESKLPSSVWTGLTDQYLSLVGPCTEAPSEFHLASFLTVLGCLIGRRAFVMNPHPLYLNFYTGLVGETGDARKSTAYEFALQLMRDVAKRVDAKVKPLRGLASIEGLATAMRDGHSNESHAILAIEDELRSLITKSQQKGVANLLPRLTELYNCPDSFEVNTRADRLLIPNPFLSIITSTTESWFQSSITDSEILGGFLNRWFFFKGETDKLIAIPEPPKEPEWARLVESIATVLLQSRGRYDLSADAKDEFTQFYLQFRKRPKNGLVKEATARTPVHAMKLATLQAVLTDHARIEVEDIMWGISIAEYSGSVVEDLVSHLSSSRLGFREQRLLSLLKKEGRLSTRELLRRLACSADELDHIVRPLVRLGLVDMNSETTPAGRKRMFVRTME